eukprot:snap_masked-scaffold_17-processed-gene-0.14-mRNA-1 protein AED:1.00 eAED:1.00 QI:0/-1/0/0/-1/1/1/0/316
MLLDSGATINVTGNKKYVLNHVPEKNIPVTGALQQKTFDTVSGKTEVTLLNNVPFTLSNVVYIPELQNNEIIVSESKLLDENFSIVEESKSCKILKNQFTFVHISRKEDHFFIHAKLNTRNNLSICSFSLSVADLMHYRLGHMNNDYLRAEGFKSLGQQFYVGCPAGKTVQRNKGKAVNYERFKFFRGTKPFEKFHIDTMGKLKPSSLGFKYPSLIVCNYSNFIIPILAKTKTEIASKVVKKIEKLRQTFNFETRCIFSDQGSEFHKLNEYCEKHGIQREFSSTYFASGNGKVERQNRSVMTMNRTILIQVNISMK